ncbi:AraC family transcriptional regulator [Burkholderia sp. Bp9017]|uniref:AraC family transcriptional regulator n=2 Tax=Burkholderiaceae TaxID=119060 RepID=A0A7T6VL94_9BURK|nr:MULTISPECIES: AraC family transcriptional regulator [Burkholderia]MBY4866854.1 AraC family transcriptional regulator [Burkholderia anthina]QQK05960.1 AraC family transcriptional regulator [Burkholderia anthina]RQZ22970.1 AraC family transcriptional regulator [Burkholderia sp. Bp9017]RQZ30561.1 AraC family transcriptional regulator [Burkholderia sp. Bp9016]
MPAASPLPTQRVYYSSTYVRLLFDYLSGQGRDAARVLGEARPPEDDRGLTLYASAHWRRLLEHAADALGDPLLGLHVGQRISPAHLGALGYALHACRDAGAALARWQQYEHLIANVARMEVRVEAASVAIEWHDAPEPLGALVDEVALTAIVQFARNITGTHDGPAEVCFVHPPPVDTQPYADYFGCPVRFGQPVNRLAFPLHLLAQPLRQPDDALLQMMERQASALLAELRQTDDLEQSVREAVARLLTRGEISIEQVASDMHVSSRTLHRRLAELGLNFRTLREDTRRRLAIDYLNDPRLTLAEVAWLLGYSEHSALTRAFRRWTGESPQQWRSRQPARATNVARG